MFRLTMFQILKYYASIYIENVDISNTKKAHQKWIVHLSYFFFLVQFYEHFLNLSLCFIKLLIKHIK